MNDWVKSLLQTLKVAAIIMIMVAAIFIWTAVPDDELNEIEDNHASKSN